MILFVTDLLSGSNLEVWAVLVIVLLCLIALLVAIILHECAHGLMAKWNGDLTAKYAGRITLNPVKHFDLAGFLMLTIVGFGYAKPVPVDPNNFKDKRKGVLLVSISGVLINLIVAIIAAFLVVIIERFGSPADLASVIFHTFFLFLLTVNVFLAVFNLLPFFPLDGYQLLGSLTGSKNRVTKFLYNYGAFILFCLIGWHILMIVITQATGLGFIMFFSPMALLTHFVGGGIIDSLLNLFRVMFGIYGGRVHWRFFI